MSRKHSKELRLLGLTIAYYRKLQGYTQIQLAEKVNVSRTHLSNIEAPNGTSSVSLDTLFDIANALDIPIKTLFDFPSSSSDSNH